MQRSLPCGQKERQCEPHLELLVPRPLQHCQIGSLIQADPCGLGLGFHGSPYRVRDPQAVSSGRNHGGPFRGPPGADDAPLNLGAELGLNPGNFLIEPCNEFFNSGFLHGFYFRRGDSVCFDLLHVAGNPDKLHGINVMQFIEPSIRASIVFQTAVFSRFVQERRAAKVGPVQGRCRIPLVCQGDLGGENSRPAHS